MKFISLIFIIFLSSHSRAQDTASISCEYASMTLMNEPHYGCYLTINNANGFDNFLVISGEHVFGFDNDNVTVVLRNAGMTTIVPRILCSQFPNLQWLDMSNYDINEITEASFTACSSLQNIDLYRNNIATLPSNAFANNRELFHFDIQENQLSSLPSNIFANNENLETLSLSFNSFEELPIGVFSNLNNLITLHLQNNQLSSLNGESFGNLSSLQNLYVNFNNIEELPADAFGNMENLQYLDLGNNPLETIHDGAFRSLRNLEILYMSRCRVNQLTSNAFEGLESLTTLYLNFNNIEELPEGVFAHFNQLGSLNMWSNRLKTLGRSSFGNLANIEMLDLDNNVINAVERSIFEEAVNLDRVLFSNNLCASGYFGSFQTSRQQNMERLERCFRIFEFTVETETDEGVDFRFFNAPQPGIVFRVQSSDEIQIALTPFNFPWTPMLEIFIGTANNTQSVIRRNREVDVVTVPTPNIIQDGQTNGFRVTWANHVVLVFREGEEFPFLVYTMQDFYPVNFYGLRTPESRATWSIQPID